MIAWCWRSEALHCGAALWDLAQEWHLGVMWCTVEVNGGNKLKLFQFSRVDGLNFTLGAWTHFFSKRLENSIDTFKVAIKAAYDWIFILCFAGMGSSLNLFRHFTCQTSFPVFSTAIQCKNFHSFQRKKDGFLPKITRTAWSTRQLWQPLPPTYLGVLKEVQGDPGEWKNAVSRWFIDWVRILAVTMAMS